MGGAAAGVWYECSREHPVQDALKRLNLRLKHDNEFKERGAILLIEASMMGRSEAEVIEALGQPSSVRSRLRNGVVTRAMTFPPFPGWTERFRVQCVDGTVRSFNPLLD